MLARAVAGLLLGVGGCSLEADRGHHDGGGEPDASTMSEATRRALGVVGPGNDAFATDACTARQFDFTCEVPRCIVTAATVASAGLNRASCVEFGDDRNGADDSRCEFPQSCLGGGFCDPTADVGPFLPPRLGCQPPEGMCFVGDGCVATDERAGPRGLQCMACQPLVSVWAYTPLPDGNECDDGNACTRNDSCSSGNCAGICDESLPTCAGECSIDD